MTSCWCSLVDNTIIAYKKDNYLLIKDTNYEIYNMYYDSDKYANFIKDITSANIYDYLTNDCSKELKPQINKIEIDTISYCFKSSLDEENFSCLTDYNIYLKDYDYNKCSYYESSELYRDIFSGSAPECEKDYILKSNFFKFKKLKNKYVIQNSFTGI